MPIDKILAFGGAIVQGARAKREAKRYRKQQKALNDKINHLEANRQDVINPYDQVTSLASMATDLSNTFSNPMANLSVATQAAEMQIEQADISLANTLDTLRATGSGAGGATALAQAALQSKKGVAAGIEQQEAGNEKLRAQGEEQLQRRITTEKQRIQNLNISEGAREQNAMARGREFEFSTQENRDISKLNTLNQQSQQAGQNAAAARAQEGQAMQGMFSAAGSMAGALGGLGGGPGTVSLSANDLSSTNSASSGPAAQLTSGETQDDWASLSDVNSYNYDYDEG